MNISPDGLKLVEDFEGYEKALPDGRCTAYQSYLGNGKYDIPTIGWGCTEGVTMGMVWTREEAEAALRKEINKFETGVLKLCKFTPTQNQFDALVSFSYNVGLGNLAKSSVLRLANAGDFHGAAAAFMMWNKAQGVPLAGLTHRRGAEAALFLTVPTSEPPIGMPRTIDVEQGGNERSASAALLNSALDHAEAHKELLSSSWTYWTSHFSIKGVVAASAGTLAFAKEYALVVASVALLAILAFELFRYAQRNKMIGAH